MSIIPRTSSRKIALLCAEAKSLRNSIESLGSSAVKFDSALQNTLNTVIDACNQFDKGVELAKTAGDILLDTINGTTAAASSVVDALTQGVTKLPSLPLSSSSEIGVILNEVFNSDFGQINTDLIFDQLVKASPPAFQNMINKINRIPVDLRTAADTSVNALAKAIDFNSLLGQTTSTIQKQSVSCIMAGNKEKFAKTNTLLAQQTQNILTDITSNLQTVAPSPVGGSFGGIGGLPFGVTDIPGLNSGGTNIFTLAGNLTGVNSAIFYIEMACNIARAADTAIDVVNDLMERYQNCMPSDLDISFNLDELVNDQLNKFFADLAGLTVDELERLKQECGQLIDSL